MSIYLEEVTSLIWKIKLLRLKKVHQINEVQAVSLT